MVAKTSTTDHGQEKDSDVEARSRILEAAFAAFMENGFAATTTLEIATRARVSKRELYARLGNKQEMLIACISERAKRLQIAADLPVFEDRETFARVLTAVGTQLVREITDPVVVGVFRLAIAEAVQSPQVARALDSTGRQAGRAALQRLMTQAQAAGLLSGRAEDLAEQFGGLLWGNLMVSLLLGVAERPDSREAATRARDATIAFLQLHPLPV